MTSKNDSGERTLTVGPDTVGMIVEGDTDPVAAVSIEMAGYVSDTISDDGYEADEAEITMGIGD